MLENLKKFYDRESPSGRMERMKPAAVYGALLASAYSLTFSFINVYTFPRLPLGMDWPRVLGMWAAASAAAALCGVIVAWFTEEYEGVVGGGLIITILVALEVLLTSGALNGTLVARTLISALPLIGVSMLAGLGIRFAIRRHLEIMRVEQPALRRKRLTGHILLIVLIGLVPGSLGRMDLPAEQTLTRLHELLQAAPNDRSVWPYLPLTQVPALQKHFGEDYLLYPRLSTLAVGTLDVTIRFADGYAFTCFLPVSSQTTFITECKEDNNVK